MKMKASKRNWRKALTFYGWPLLVVPVFLLFLGWMSNSVALLANKGAMPVLIPECSFMDSSEGGMLDHVHVCMSKGTHLKVLCDWIFDSDGTRESPGDVVIDTANAILAPSIVLWFALAIVAIETKKDFYLK